jgi:transcriptional regulator with XRE-family HTH domain
MSEPSVAWTPACGAFVRTARERDGLSQDELAELVGVARNTISRIETGSRSPSVEVLFALADKLRIDLNLLRPDPFAEAPTDPMPDLIGDLDPPSVA